MIAVAWFVVACAMAVARVPFDDEWFSITLARVAESATFWKSLRHDIHPPLVAVIDRFVLDFSHTDHWLSLQILRVAVSTVALVLVMSVLLRRVGKQTTPRGLILLGAFHPIVLFYGGAVRWYPYLFLAQALRWWAIWGESDSGAGKRKVQVGGVGPMRLMALFAGAVLGPAVGYVDAPFVALDLVFFHGRHRRGDKRFARWVAGLAGALGLASFGVSAWVLSNFPLHGAGGHHVALHRVLTWLGLGLTGEAQPPWPWILVAPAVALVPLVGFFWHLRGDRGSARLFSLHVLAVFSVWVVLALLRVSHPRYSLLLWVVLPAFAAAFWAKKWGRPLYLGYALYLLLSLGLAFQGHSFVKRDLNAMRAGDCRRLLGKKPPRFVIVPYLRDWVFIRERCPEEDITMIGVPWIRHYPEEAAQFGELRLRMERERPRELGVILAHFQGSSLAVTQRRVVRFVARHCTKIGERRAGRDPHATIRRMLFSRRHGGGGRSGALYRFLRWRCRW